MIGSGSVAFALMGYIIAHMRPPNFDVELNPKLLAFILGDPEDQIEKAIGFLCSPDPKSRSKAEEGRRLVRRSEYLYHVVNGETYNAIRNDADKKAYWRDQKKRQRLARQQGSAADTDVEPRPPAAASNGKYHEDASDVIDLINKISGKDFRKVESNLVPISERLREDGVDFEGVAKMLRRQWELWKDTFTKDDQPRPMREYFQPSTLFRPKNFGNYYASRDLPITKPKPKSAEPNQIQEVIDVPTLNL